MFLSVDHSAPIPIKNGNALFLSVKACMTVIVKHLPEIGFGEQAEYWLGMSDSSSCLNSCVFAVELALDLGATARRRNQSPGNSWASLMTSEQDQSSNQDCRKFLGVMGKLDQASWLPPSINKTLEQLVTFKASSTSNRHQRVLIAIEMNEKMLVSTR